MKSELQRDGAFRSHWDVISRNVDAAESVAPFELGQRAAGLVRVYEVLVLQVLDPARAR